jgi:cytidylate kinase
VTPHDRAADDPNDRTTAQPIDRPAARTSEQSDPTQADDRATKRDATRAADRSTVRAAGDPDSAQPDHRTTEVQASARPERRVIIAIDGPSGAGKGTVARAVAQRLRYRHIDTGAMYRAVAWKALQEGVELTNADAMLDVAQRIRIIVGDGVVSADGHDIARAIRTPEIDAAAAAVARQPRVRGVLIAQQREMGRDGGIVMEGRDIGTVVFPHAEVKVYLDASPDERARRRAQDPAQALGHGTSVGEVATALQARDHSDRTRAASPLTRADDAVEIDTTGLSIEETIERVLELVMEKGGTDGDGRAVER